MHARHVPDFTTAFTVLGLPELTIELATEHRPTESQPCCRSATHAIASSRPAPAKCKGDGESPDPHLGLRAVARAEPLRLLELTESPG